MMAVVGKNITRKLFSQPSSNVTLQVRNYLTDVKPQKGWRKRAYPKLALLGGAVAGLVYYLDRTVSAYDWPLHPPHQHWSHNGIISSLDHASIRRGFEVYRNVCATCHSLEYVPFRRLVDVAYTEKEMKDIAAEYQIKDGPDETGEYYMRPGKLSDYFPKPYENTEAAKNANNGAVPPDLSFIVLARHGAEDYIFSLLNGYQEPPAGVHLEPGANYNPYFQGSIIAMAPPLYTNIFEYSDGTPATQSQLAKDVCTFLVWSGQPEWDLRHSWVIKVNLFLGTAFLVMLYITRHKFTTLRTRKVLFTPKKE